MPCCDIGYRHSALIGHGRKRWIVDAWHEKCHCRVLLVADPLKLFRDHAIFVACSNRDAASGNFHGPAHLCVSEIFKTILSPGEVKAVIAAIAPA